MNRTSLYAPFKRALDVLIASALLLLLWPLLALIAGVVWLDSGRPILFRQTRIGLHGRPFTILKFRTLHAVPHALTDPLAAVTRSGVFLRRWGLDELPQLWNVIRGDMSLVGPRPTVPSQVAHYGPTERVRLDVRPGLTGWAQVRGRNALSWDSRIAIDVEYVRRTSLALDLCILFRTPLALLSADDAYGIGGKNGDFTPRANPGARAA
ncbi:MAG: sugar transferase [Rhodothermales bacterium]